MGGRGEHVGLGRTLRRPSGGERCGEGVVVLQFRQHPAREQPHILFRVGMRNAAEREFGDHMVGAGHPLQFGDLLNAVFRRPDDLDLDIKFGGPDLFAPA